MAPNPLSVYPFAVSSIVEGGESATAAFGPVAGGFIVNPNSPADQGIALKEVLFVDVVNPAGLVQSATTVALQPGDVYFFPPNLTTNVSVNAATSGHKFGGVVYQSPTPFPPEPQPGTFPPAGPTTLTATLNSYPYKQYKDDDDVTAFFNGFNELAQVYASWFGFTTPADYTSAAISGSLLDWVALGLYGFERPSLGSGRNHDIGPLNTYPFNTLPLNRRKLIGQQNVVATSDDVFKRIITWNFYKGDGNVFNARWLKRRIKRFLIGVNGTAPNIDETYDISVTFGSGIVTIQISTGTRTVIGGALPNRFGLNRMTLNGLRTQFTPSPTTQYPLAPVLQEAVEAGVLTFPVQLTPVILIST